MRIGVEFGIAAAAFVTLQFILPSTKGTTPLIPRTYEHGMVVVAEYPKPGTCRFELAPTGKKPHHWTDVLGGGTCQSLRVGSHYELKTGWNFTIYQFPDRIFSS